MADTINKIVGQKAFDEINKLEEGLEGLYKSFERIGAATKDLELGLSSAKGLKEIIDSYGKISREAQKLEKLQSDLALAEQKLRTEREKTAKVTQTTAIQQAREIDRQIDRAERLAKAEERRAKAEEKASSGSTNIYDHYRKKQRELTIQLRALEIQYQLTTRSGRANADELKRQRDAIAPLEKEYKELTAVLDEVENRTGGSTRSRNQMLVETNQLLREMPNFAISAQTGILSLSNNLPMFFEAWERTSQEIDTTTNSARGFKGAMKEFVGSLFSVQTALVVLVTLMVQYGDEIVDFVTNVSDAEKYQRRFNEALKESLNDKANEIAILQKLKTVMADTNTTMAERNKAIEEARGAFEGYFDNINSVTSSLDEMNLAIERQLLYLQQQAEYEAQMSSIAEYAKDAQIAQMELNKEFDLWENVWNNLRREFIKYPIYDKMSESGRKYIDTMAELHKTNIISENDYRTAWVRVKEYEESQGKLNQSLIEGNKGLSEQERSVSNLIIKLKEELSVAQQIHKNNIERYGFADKKIVNEINNINILISKNEELLAKQRQQREEQERARRDTNSGGITDEEQALMMARTELYKARKDTKDYLSANANLIWTQFAVDVRNLQSQFDKLGGYSKDNEKYMTSLAELEAKRDASLRENVLSTKKERKEKQSIWDIDRAILEVREKLADLNNDIKSAQLNEASVNYRDIVDNESKALDERLANLELYYKNEKAKIEFEKDKELEIIKEGEIRKKELEKRLNTSINTEQDLQRLVREKKLNDEQKNFLAMTLTYNKQREKIGNEANAKLTELEKGRADDATGVIKSDYDKRVAEYQNGLQQVTDAIRNGTNAQILELNKKRKEVGMTETQYYRELESIIKGEGTKVISSQLEFIEEYKSSLESLVSSEEYQNMSVQSKNTINLMLDYLTNAYADATRRIQKDTSKYKGFGEMIRGWFGKGEDGEFNTTQSEIDDMIGGVLNSFQSMFASLNQMWDNYYTQRQQDVDEEQSRFDTYYKNEQYRIESSLESQEEKERLQKELDGQRLASEQELDRKRKEIARQQALRDKQQALFNATIQTATGVMNIWSKGYNPIISAVMTAALLATMAAQVAAIQSAPIPAYEKGTPKDGHKGGLALVGEKRRELVITPDGQMFYTPNNPTLMNLPSGTHVLPNPDAMSKQAKMEAVSRLNRTRRNSGGFDVSLLSHDIKTLTSVVKNKQENYFDFSKGDMRKMVKKNNARINYIGRC